MTHRALDQIWSRPWRQIITGEIRGWDQVVGGAELFEASHVSLEYMA